MKDVSVEMTEEEKKYVQTLHSNIELRKLEISNREWKLAFERLADWTRKNFGNTTLFDVTSKIKELRPYK